MRTLTGETIEKDLHLAYLVLAEAYLSHRGGGGVLEGESDIVSFDRRITDTEKHMDLRAARTKCTLIQSDGMRPVEVYNNLNHMFVILQALPILRAKGYMPTVCAPTQQSVDDQGTDIPDLGGESWSLEAYGGHKIENNGKLAKDLKKLKGSVHAHRFLACRKVSWARVGRAGEAQPISAWCSRKHGGAFRAKATASLLDSSSLISVFAIHDIQIIA